MDTNNPAEMSNQDLENDMPQQNEAEKTTGNQESVRKSTAAEGDLIAPKSTTPEIGEVDALGFKKEDNDDSQDGSMPDPESLDTWESTDDDHNKISG